MSVGAFLNANGDLVGWDALDEAEQSFYEGTPLAEGIVEHVCRYWNEVALTEFYFERPEYVPDVA